MVSGDIYCDRCDVFGHENYSEECEIYWSSVEAPLPPDMWDLAEERAGRDPVMVELPPGTYVRLSNYTPWMPGMKSGNHFYVETLDGKFGGSQVHLGELQELEVLDRLTLLDEAQKGSE